MKTKFSSKLYNVESNPHYLSQSQVNYLQKENLFRKVQDDTRDFQYSVSPCSFRQVKKIDFSQRLSVSELKKWIPLHTEHNNQLSQKYTFNSQDYLKNYSVPLFKQRINNQTKKQLKKSRTSLNLSNVSTGTSFKDRNVLSNSFYNRTNLYFPQNKEGRSNQDENKIQALASKLCLERVGRKEESKQNLAESHYLWLKEKSKQERLLTIRLTTPSKIREVSTLRIKQKGAIQIQQMSPLKKKQISPLKSKQMTSQLIHTRYPSSYAHLHQSTTKNNKVQFKKEPRSIQFLQKQNYKSKQKDQKKEQFTTSISRLSFTSSLVEIKVSSEPAKQESEMTARFNFVQQKRLQAKRILQIGSTPIGQTLKVEKQKGLSLSQFIIGPCKGKGRYGKVHLVIDKLTGAVFALKQISLQSISKIMTQFISEIKLQTYFNHPYITKVYGYFIEHNHFYIIMEYMNEGCLYELIKRLGCISQLQTATKLKQVGQGLWQMHKNNIIHRDLKPQNIVIIFGVCKICDFSWVAISKSQQRRQTNCGTLDYLSPQIIQGKTYTNSIDLWSMGVLLYQMLVGKPPFYNVSVKETANQIKQCKFTFPPGLSADSKNLILCFLRKDPSQRKEMEQILQNPFFSQVQQ